VKHFVRAIAAILLLGLVSLPLSVSRRPQALAQAPLRVVVEPDEGRQPLLDAIGGARQSIDLVIYELTDSRITSALEQAAVHGVAVRVLAEPLPGGRALNARTMAELASKGVQTESSAPGFYLTHEKAMVVDGASALIMSMNLVAETFDGTRDVAVVDADPADVAEIESVFQADWDRQPVSLSDPALVWSPENARERLLGLLGSATASIDIYAEELTDRQIESALLDAVDRGVQIRVLMTDTGSRDPARPARAELVAAGAQARLLARPFVHAKVVIVDGGTAFAGSENFTATSLDENRELGLITSDLEVIGRLSASFNQDWQRATPAP
jgi:cardiolipin synthase